MVCISTYDKVKDLGPPNPDIALTYNGFIKACLIACTFVCVTVKFLPLILKYLWSMHHDLTLIWKCQALKSFCVLFVKNKFFLQHFTRSDLLNAINIKYLTKIGDGIRFILIDIRSEDSNSHVPHLYFCACCNQYHIFELSQWLLFSRLM